MEKARGARKQRGKDLEHLIHLANKTLQMWIMSKVKHLGKTKP